MDLTVILESIPDSEGGGYRAYVPDMGEWTCQADGDTPEEALERVIELYRYLADGLDGSVRR